MYVKSKTKDSRPATGQVGVWNKGSSFRVFHPRLGAATGLEAEVDVGAVDGYGSPQGQPRSDERETHAH
jgi:hypothetical protein